MYTSVSTLIPTYDFTYSNCFSVPVVFYCLKKAKNMWKRDSYIDDNIESETSINFWLWALPFYQPLVMASLWSKATRGFEEKQVIYWTRILLLTWGGIMIAGLGHSNLELFRFSFGKILIFLEGKINAPSTGKESISFVPPSNSFVSALDLWRAFWVDNGHGALQGHLAFLPELQRYKETQGLNCGVSRTTCANLDVFC